MITWDQLRPIFEERDARITELEKQVVDIEHALTALAVKTGVKAADVRWARTTGRDNARYDVLTRDRCYICNGRDGAHEDYCQRGKEKP